MKVLFITPEDIPEKCQTGGMQCVARDFQAIQKIYGENNVQRIFVGPSDTLKNNNSVMSYPMIENRVDKLFNALKGRRYLSKSVENQLIEAIMKLKADIIFIVGPYFGSRIMRLKNENTKIILIEQNVEKSYYQMLTKKKKHMWLLQKAVEKQEKLSVNNCDYIICLNQRDSDLMKECYNRTADFLSYISFEDQFDENKVNLECDRELLFIGSYFEPNYDGIKWFIENVMTKLPEFRLSIVGKNFEKVRQELEQKNVKVIGTVDNLEKYYYRFPVIVMPILYGAGMKVKTAEAMMYGKTILASDEALVGYETDGIKGIFRCNTAEEYIEVIQDIFNKKNIYNFSEDQQSVRNLYLGKYNTAGFEKRLKEYLEGECLR